jgi:DNA-binding winged helix-turn-helix (wHTH) protein/TolB-like protein/Flp pilus assembly protein TadD
MLERDGAAVALSGKAFEILVALLNRAGEVVDKETLMREVWPDTAVEDNNLTVNISWLRKALGEAPNDPRYIVTIPGRGYRFIGDLRAPETAAAQPAPPRRRPSHVWIAAAVVSIAVIILVWLLAPHGGALPNGRSLAVLPFRVLSADARTEYLGVGLADALITRLGNLGDISVRPLNSAMRVADKDPLAAGRELGADTVLDGKVQLANDRVRVTVQLLRVRDGASLWAESFDEQMANPFALEDAVSSRIASSLVHNLSGAQKTHLAKRYTQNRDAYENYLRGRYYALKYTEDGLRKGLDYLHKAIDADPTYALAYSGLADCYYDASNMLFPPLEAMPKAKAAAQRSVELDPLLAEAHVSLGIVASKFDWDWREADAQFTKALALDPNSAIAHQWYGVYRAEVGDMDRAIAELRRARELDPLSQNIAGYTGNTLYWARRYPDALAQAQKMIGFDPAFFPAYITKAWILEALDRPAEAVAACEKARQISPSPWTSAALARAYALDGNRPASEKILQDQLRKSPGEQFVSDYDLATVYAALGDTERAFGALEDAYQSRSEWLSYIKVDPQLDSLRADRRFAAMLQKIGLDRSY